MWPLFIEKLLLAIIDANPLEEFADPKPERNSRRTRLEEAMHALFGTSISKGDAPINDVARSVAIARDRMRLEQEHALVKAMLTPGELERQFIELEEKAKVKGKQPPSVEAVRAGWRVVAKKLPVLKKFAKSVPHSPDASKRDRNTDNARLRDEKYPQLQEYLSWLAVFGGHEEETCMLRDLRDIAAVLERWNVPTSVDPARLALGSQT